MISKNHLSGQAGWDNAMHYSRIKLIPERYRYDVSITGVV